jgi:hypothetical protein
MLIDSKNILKDIYEKIYLRESESQKNIFLCGKSIENSVSLRGEIYSVLEPDPRFNVVFPEWLFSSLDTLRNFNLLDLERILADHVDVIILPLEGLGTFAEIGCFASFPELLDKIIVINDQKYKNEKSFVNLGPIKQIKGIEKRNIIYYQNQLSHDDKKNIVNRIKNISKKVSKSKIDNLFNLSRFILIVVSVFQPISEDDIKVEINKYTKEIELNFVNPCLNLLSEKKMIQIQFINAEKKFILSEQGHEYIIEELVSKLNVIKEFSKIRTKILNYYYRKKNKFNFEGKAEIF